MSVNIYIGQTLTPIRLDLEKDVSSASVKEILYEKPNGVKGKWTATLMSGSTEIIEYVPSVTDLDVVGVWKIQSHVVLSGYHGYGNVVSLRIHENLE